jgi:hypothetical protein
MKFSKTWILAIISIFSLLVIVYLVRERSSDIRENGILINVKIVDILIPSKGAGSFNFRCSFTYTGEQKLLISPTSVKENGSRYIGKICPALFSPKTNNLRVLLQAEDFDDYNIPLTDSLIMQINKIEEY